MPQTVIQKAKKKAAALGVQVKESTRKKKKLDVYSRSGEYLVSIGDLRYSDFLQHGDEKRRQAYRKRHQKNRLIKGSAGYFASEILW